MNGRKNAKQQGKMGQALVQQLETREPSVKLNDPVNRPSHYTQGKVECIDAIESMLGPAAFIGFLRGQVVKYTWRMEHKGGKQDAQKAQWYNNLLIAKLEEYANAGTR